MKKLLVLSFFYVFCVVNLFAQSPMSILDKAASKLKHDGGLSIEYTMNSEGGAESGFLEMMGKKFHSKMKDVETWYDGKNLWSYVVANNEVNLIKPKAAQLAKVNPYYFLGIYKKGYTLKNGSSNSSYYEVLMTADDSKSSIYKATIRIDKKTYALKYIKVTNAKNVWIEVKMKNYKKGLKFGAGTFAFSKSKYPKVEVIDLR
ncbi:MAG: hypothetical protein KBT06_08915 [Prevotellaceae bacterium]|nr:hypothetical protein [Candidatus Colivivens equi]